MKNLIHWYGNDSKAGREENYKLLIFHIIFMEKEKDKKINLKDIPQDSCKIFQLENTRVAVCHEPTGEFSFFELKPIQPIHTYEAGAKNEDLPKQKSPSHVAGAMDNELE